MERTGLVYSLIIAAILTLALIRVFLVRTKRLQGLFKFLGALEISFISFLLAMLVFLGCLQIVLRNFFHSGILWADPLMRHIVLWLGCLGGAMATTRMRHINIDVFTRMLPGAMMGARNRLIHLATAIAASVLGTAALKLVIDEREFGELAFLNIHVWMLQVILPVAFFLISYRSVLNMILLPKEKPLEWDEHDTQKESHD